MTHILGALWKARNENISPSPRHLINFNITNPMNKTMNRITPFSAEFMPLSKALGMYRCGSMGSFDVDYLEANTLREVSISATYSQ